MSICFFRSRLESNSRRIEEIPFEFMFIRLIQHIQHPTEHRQSANTRGKNFLARARMEASAKSLSQCVQGNIPWSIFARPSNSAVSVRRSKWSESTFSSQPVDKYPAAVIGFIRQGFEQASQVAHRDIRTRCACAHRLARHGTEFEATRVVFDRRAA